MLIDKTSFEGAPTTDQMSGPWNEYANIGAGAGLIAGTKVASNLGWRSVESVAPGDKVLTFDHGLQVVTGVTRSFLWIGEADCPESAWPLMVPAGALGNQADMWIAPEQHVLIESDIAERVYGDPFVVIPALSLEGHKGIERRLPDQVIEVIQLQFAQDEVVFANMGALFFCPKANSVIDAAYDQRAPLRYVPLSLEHADILVCHLDEDFGEPEQADESRENTLQNHAA